MVAIVDVSGAEALAVLDAVARLEAEREVARRLEDEHDRRAEVEVADHLALLDAHAAAAALLQQDVVAVVDVVQRQVVVVLVDVREVVAVVVAAVSLRRVAAVRDEVLATTAPVRS